MAGTKHTEKVFSCPSYQLNYQFDSNINGRSEGTFNGSDLPTLLVSDVTTGPNLPNWRQLIKSGQDATTAMEGHVRRILRYRVGYQASNWKEVPIGNDFPNTYEQRQIFGSGLIHLSPLTFLTDLPLTVSVTADNRALARFNEKVALVNRQFQGGVFFGELAQTLHGIRHPAEALFKGIERYSIAATKLRRSFVKNRAAFETLSKARRRQVAKSFSSAASGLWLENSFHWLPLMYDIQGAVSALKHSWDGMRSTFVKASATDVESEAGTWSNGLDAVFPYTVRITGQSGTSVRYYGKVRVSQRYPGVPDTAALGVDALSYIPTIWELIPYSWAVDYFTNIGSIIYGFSQGGVDVVWSARGTKRWRQLQQIHAASGPEPTPTSGWKTVHYYHLVLPSEVAYEEAVIHRASYIGTFIPDFEWKVPGMSLKWLNLGAAFLQRSLAFL